MCFGNSGERGTLCTMCRLPSEASGEGGSDKSDKSDKSDILCPQYRHCAMCFASQQPPLLRPALWNFRSA